MFSDQNIFKVDLFAQTQLNKSKNKIILKAYYTKVSILKKKN